MAVMRTVSLVVIACLVCWSGAAGQQVTVDLGFVNASGNANFTSLNLGEKLSDKFGRVTLTQNAKALYGRTDGATTTESYDAGARAQYGLTKRIGLYALLAFQRDPFAGLASRWLGGPGVAVSLVQSGRDTLGIESGVTSTRERNTANVTQSFAAARTAANLKHVFAGKSFFTETLEWVANLKTSDDQRLNSETALTAPLSRQIGLRVSYLVRFDNQPEPGFKKTDRILTTGVQIAF
jgi:putative salt-induced outer membrane protein